MAALEGKPVSRELEALFSRFQRERPQLEQSIEELKAALARYSGIVLYGAGSSGIALLLALRRAGIEPLCFTDGDLGKWGQVCMGLQVEPPQEAGKKYGRGCLAIVCINTDGQTYCRSFDEALRQGGHSGVHQRLRDWGYAHVVDYVALRRCVALFRGDDTGNLPSCPDVDCILAHQTEIEQVWEQLGDAQSREIYANILAFRLFGEGPEIATLAQEEKYFPSELISLSQREVLVDCGAFDGQTLRDTLDRTGGHLEGYFALEPDPTNLEKLRQYTAALPENLRQKITIAAGAAWGEEGVLPFCALGGPGSFAASYGGSQVQAVTIDRLLDGRRATAIKMNIEGAELAALEGARETIRRWKPKLMIAGYHKTWDFWKVPGLMRQAGYQVYLRSYMHHLSFVFYGLAQHSGS